MQVTEGPTLRGRAPCFLPCWDGTRSPYRVWGSDLLNAGGGRVGLLPYAFFTTPGPRQSQSVALFLLGLFNETNRDAVIADLTSWLDRHRLTRPQRARVTYASWFTCVRWVSMAAHISPSRALNWSRASGG